ncbi:alpha,alpha-trehalose-phosphate synthase [UDP-forming] 6-like [Phalaenopsis equestris]|uniref:alpha,alpha-trehalose-phosphate synthase [UDP-forming] 6-like n=1 Tax=Phalaenopsis equestris TaxID=78828 RepID=UPI0009E1B449|nr:alpha,alpha-trehalose-phosphate synthase [UDP-forming] 6-like [Phalaenopsis equestris]
MASKSYSNLLELASGDPPPVCRTAHFTPRHLLPSATGSFLSHSDSNSELDPSFSLSSSTPRTIIVANHLPLCTGRRSDGSGWSFSFDHDSLLLQLRDSLPSSSNLTFVGCLRDDIIPPSDHDEVSQHLLHTFRCLPLFLPAELHSRFYLGFCKRHLWPLFHYLLPLSPELASRFDRSLWQAYVSVNKLFADKLLEVINPDHDSVWLHDYHLMALPTFLRKRFNCLKLGFFLHSPFPSSEIYRTLPVREEILRSLLNSDLIGFHTFDYARHFLSCCSRMLGLTYQSHRGYIELDYYGRAVNIKILPVGIHLGRLQRVLSLHETESLVARIMEQFADKTILLGVDDFDIFKGISLKLLAMEQLLALHPKWRGKAVLIQIANPARGRGKDVKEVQAETFAIVRRINETYGTSNYRPVILFDKPLSFCEKIAYYVAADCCLITAVRDGMNLIPYEYVIARQGNENLDRVLGLSVGSVKKSMLVLSEFIGCSPSLSGAIRVNPWDIEAVADAMDSALEMPETEKQLRHEKHFQFVSTHDVGYWAHSFLQDLQRSCKDHLTRRCWGIGFGLGFRVVALDNNFRKLSMEHILTAYRKSKTRALLLDYDGTLMPQSTIDKRPSSKLVEILNSLCNEKNNSVFLVSGKSRRTLSDWFYTCENLAIAAEHGCFIKLKRDSAWETCVPLVGCDWKQVVEPVMKLYTDTTDGSTIEDNETALVWSYEDADPDFGSCQAKELLSHLESVLANEPVSVKAGPHKVEVKPQGVSKGLVVERMLSTLGAKVLQPDFILCIGDDRSDEQMFEVINNAMTGPRLGKNAEVFACTVGQKPSKAKYYLDDTIEIMRLIQGLAFVSLTEQEHGRSSSGSSIDFDGMIQVNDAKGIFD